MADPPDVAQKEENEKLLIQKIENSVVLVRKMAAAGAPEGVEQAASLVAEFLKTITIDTEKAGHFRDVLKAIQCESYELSIDGLVSEAERLGHAGDDAGRNATLAIVRRHFGKAIGFGADDEFRRAVERRIEAAMMTTADGVDERTKKANAQKLNQQDAVAGPPEGVGERRRAIRYGDPVLEAEMNGRRYATINWSVRGALLEPHRGHDPAPGDHVRIAIRCAEAPKHPAGRLSARVVRFDEERSALALDFGEMSTVVLALVHALREVGIKPEPER